MTETIVVGGGFFGMYIAEHLALRGHRVTLLEREAQPMMRASFHNQARVHNGYHYPRSILTALRSRLSFPRFSAEFADSIVTDFEKYYLVGKPLGNVSARQFRSFCEHIGATCETAPDRIQKLVNPNFVEACFSTVEFAFDADRIRMAMSGRLDAAGVRVALGTTALRVERVDGRLQVDIAANDSGAARLVADQVFNCAYSNLNYLNRHSGLASIPLKHELTEICLVDMPEELKHAGLTVMCGPFFSAMPFPPRGLHSFSHVRYTPHREWRDQTGREGPDYLEATERRSAWAAMQADAARYVPVLAECAHRDSLWEVKTVLPRSETDDSRPILLLANHGIEGMHAVLGSKIDNVYDVVAAIDRLGLAA